MATLTLAEATKFYGDDITTGIAETIIDTNPIFDILPFTSFVGDTLKINDEATLGDAGNYAIGDTITHKGAGTYTERFYTPIKLIGDVELDELVRATSQSGGTDQTAMQIMSKSKSIARLFQTQMVAGTGTAPEMNSFVSMLDANQQKYADDTGAAGGAGISFELLDELLELVKSKDGQVDFIMMSPSMYRSYKALIRAAGGNTTDLLIKAPNSQDVTRTILSYEGVPVYTNSFMSVTEGNDGTGTGTFQSIYAGNFDDGSKKIGVMGIYPEGTAAGINVERIGKSHDHDQEIIRLKQYTNLAIGNSRWGLARMSGFTV